MTKGNPKWEQFEHHVQEFLNLRSTPGSGNQWHDVSDGRSRSEDSYKLMVDCKFTESKSYSLNGKLLQGWYDKATELGYHFALPVRLEGSAGRTKEWVAITLDDYVELVESMRILNGPSRCGSRTTSASRGTPCIRSAGHTGKHDNGQVEWDRADWGYFDEQGVARP